MKKLFVLLLFCIFFSSCSSKCASYMLFEGRNEPIKDSESFIIEKPTSKPDNFQIDFIVEGKKLNSLLQEIKKGEGKEKLEVEEIHFGLSGEGRTIFFRSIILDNHFFILEASHCKNEEPILDSYFSAKPQN